MEVATFWDDPKEAKKVIDESNKLKFWTESFSKISSDLDNLKELFPEAYELEDQQLIDELSNELSLCDKHLSELEIKKMFSGELDDKSCYLSINAGAGGTEACDWVAMLSRMYQRWSSKKGWKLETIDRVEGEVAGIKNITFKLDGTFAYGYSKSEKGVHRLVRISPFDSSGKRHTSFASVDIVPCIEDDIEIEVRPDEIRVDTFRASGAGGQHVNVTDSAVRMTHIPSGIVVSCQKERSQIQNRETCLKMLKSKLYEQQVMEREAALKEIGGEKKEIAWGSQIRNYVFQPYTMVKDTRTKYEEGNVQAVMDGEIDDFVEAYLKEFG